MCKCTFRAVLNLYHDRLNRCLYNMHILRRHMNLGGEIICTNTQVIACPPEQTSGGRGTAVPPDDLTCPATLSQSDAPVS